MNRLALFACFFALALGAPRVHAGEPRRASKPLVQTLGPQALPLYEAGVALYRQHEFERALAQFRAAYKAQPEPRLLWNMAVCEKNLTHYAASRALTAQYLDEAGAGLSEAERREATEFATSLKAFVATLTVESTPPGATIAIDGEARGGTPLTIDLDMGEHDVRASAPSHRDVTEHVRLEGASERTLRIALTPEAAKLTVTSNGSHAVSVDGRLVGRTPWTGAVPPGPHAVTLSERGYKERHAEVKLGAGESRAVDLALDAESGAHWPWIAGAVVAVAGIGVGSYFLLRPSPNERPAPTQGTIGAYQVP